MPRSSAGFPGRLAVSRARSMAARVWNSAVAWSWAFNALRLASGVLLLPLLLRILSAADLGFHYVLLNLAAVSPLLDFGLSVSIDRGISYAMGGMAELKAQGITPQQHAFNRPNYSLLWKLLRSTRLIYRLLAVVLLVGLGVVGSYVVSLRIKETSNPSIAWAAWAVTLSSVVFEIYSSWWNVFLRGLNCVVLSGRILFLGYAIKLALACGLLLSGGGLLSVPIAGIFAGFVVRGLSRKGCLQVLSSHPAPPTTWPEMMTLLRTLWPNSWRAGAQLGSSYLGSNMNAIICQKKFGLIANAEYGLSVQIANIVAGMAAVWTNVKWPLVGQYRVQQDHQGLRRLLWPRLWWQTVTFIFLATAVCLAAPPLLAWVGSDKRMLPRGWMLLLLANTFLETQIAFWTTLLSTENRIPSLVAVVTANVLSLFLVLLLVNLTDLGLGAFVISPLISGVLFNYWYWPKAGARSLQTTWLRFTFSRPS